MSYLITHDLEQKTLEETGKKYPSPENCPLLDVPKVNRPIWEKLDPVNRARDLKLQRIQNNLVKGVTSFAHTLSAADISERQQDALGLLCNSIFELNALRKDQIKPVIDGQYYHLCKPQLPVTKYLFGDDLGKKVRDIQDEQKAVAGVVKGTKSSGKRPHSQSSTTLTPVRGMNNSVR